MAQLLTVNAIIVGSVPTLAENYFYFLNSEMYQKLDENWGIQKCLNSKFTLLCTGIQREANNIIQSRVCRENLVFRHSVLYDIQQCKLGAYAYSRWRVTINEKAHTNKHKKQDFRTFISAMTFQRCSL